MSLIGYVWAKFTEPRYVRFRNGPLFVKSSEWYLAAGLVLPFVVDRVAAT